MTWAGVGSCGCRWVGSVWAGVGFGWSEWGEVKEGPGGEWSRHVRVWGRVKFGEARYR